LTGRSWVADTYHEKRDVSVKAMDCGAPDAAHIQAEDDGRLFGRAGTDGLARQTRRIWADEASTGAPPTIVRVAM
jgi:hypothetical protein